MKLLLLITVFSLSIFASEPSAFGAGDLDAKNPYGLTESEKKIFENKKKVRNLTSKYSFVDAKVKDTQTTVEGMRSEVDELSRHKFIIDKKLSIIESILGIVSNNESNTSENNSSNETPNAMNLKLDTDKKQSIAQRLDKIEKYIKRTRAIEKRNYARINSTLKKLANLLDKTRNQCIKKAEYKRDINARFEAVFGKKK